MCFTTLFSNSPIQLLFCLFLSQIVDSDAERFSCPNYEYMFTKTRIINLLMVIFAIIGCKSVVHCDKINIQTKCNFTLCLLKVSLTKNLFGVKNRHVK
jgi:hypothetical protein